MRKLACFIFVLAVGALPRLSRAAEAKAPAILQGEMTLLPGKRPAVESHGKLTMLASGNSYLFHTLQDKRLAGKEVRLEGSLRPDGAFETAKLFTVHNGKLYRVRYYCEVCNIAAIEPGKCVCCQQPTELQEIPVDRASN